AATAHPGSWKAVKAQSLAQCTSRCAPIRSRSNTTNQSYCRGGFETRPYMHHHVHEILLLAMGGIMSKPSLVCRIAAGFVWPSLAVQAQDLPAGPGNEVATTYCNAWHTLLSRVGN